MMENLKMIKLFFKISTIDKKIMIAHFMIFIYDYFGE
jgi:hypothetical protein